MYIGPNGEASHCGVNRPASRTEVDYENNSSHVFRRIFTGTLKPECERGERKHRRVSSVPRVYLIL
jgi:hypothetical protein